MNKAKNEKSPEMQNQDKQQLKQTRLNCVYIAGLSCISDILQALSSWKFQQLLALQLSADLTKFL